MKVIHVITRLDFGGAQQNTLHTVSSLSRHGFDVILASGPGGILDGEAVEKSRGAEDGFKLRFFPELLHPIRPAYDLIALLQLFQFFKQESPCAVHTHSSKAGILGRLAAWMAGVPVIVHTYHGFGFQSEGPGRASGMDDPSPRLRFRDGFRKILNSLRIWILILAERLACRACDASIFVSRDNQERAERLGLISKDRSVLIRSGIRLSEYPAPLADRSSKRASLGCGAENPLIVSIGNLKPQKNPESFVRMAARALSSNPELRFVFIGEGELRCRVESMIAEKKLVGKVFFPGWRRDVPEILAAADIFVLNSLWEGLPRSLVEAMKTGLPCVCFASDGVRDLLRQGQNGVLIENQDEEGMALEVLRLSRDPERARLLGLRGSESIGLDFDIDAMVVRQESLYRRIQNSKPAFRGMA